MIQGELSQKASVLEDSLSQAWEDEARVYMKDIRAGLAEINSAPLEKQEELLSPAFQLKSV